MSITRSIVRKIILSESSSRQITADVSCSPTRYSENSGIYQIHTHKREQNDGCFGHSGKTFKHEIMSINDKRDWCTCVAILLKIPILTILYDRNVIVPKYYYGKLPQNF